MTSHHSKALRCTSLISLNMADTSRVQNGWLGNLFVKFDPGRGKIRAPIVEDLLRKSGLTTAKCDAGTQGILMGPPGAGKGTQVWFFAFIRILVQIIAGFFLSLYLAKN